MLDLIAEPEAPRPAAGHALPVTAVGAGDVEQAAWDHLGEVADHAR